MKVKDKSIQIRIIKLFVGFTCFISLIYSVLLLSYSWVVEDNIFNRLVAEESAFIEKHYEESGALIKPRAPFLSLYKSWQDLSDDIYKQHLKDPQQVEFNLEDGTSIHVKAIELKDKTVVLAADISKFEVGKDYLPFVFLSLLSIIILIAIIALILSYFIAKGAISPLKTLTFKVAAGKEKPIESGFSTEFPDNEIGFLAKSIEDSFIHVQTLLRREEDFTRDVSHELRTPTTVLKNILDEVKHSPQLSKRQFQYFTSSVNQLEQTITTLLALAREESQETKTLSFLHLIENCVVGHFELAKRDDFALEIDIPESFEVNANPNLLNILVNNLLSNALQYSSSNSLQISLDGEKIVFENESDYNHTKNPFDSNVKRNSSDGLGLGLYLVKRVCDTFHWRVTSELHNNHFKVVIETNNLTT